MLNCVRLSPLLVLLALLAHPGPLQAAPAPAQALAPQATVAAMRPGGISLRWESRWLGPEPGDVFLHLYAVPVGRATESEDNRDSRSDAPIEREEITTDPSLLPSPFYLDLFARAPGGSLRRLNTLTFTEDKDVNRIVVKWVEPGRRRGPVLLLDFGEGQWREWIVVTFPQGLAAEPTVQRFLWGGEGEAVYNLLRFDSVDARGYLRIREDWREENGSGTRFHTWNGFEFREPGARYFVIAASTKTRAEAEAFIRRERLQESAEVQPSDRYPRLKPGYFIVLLSRHSSLGEATAMAKSYQKNGGVRASVQTAF